MLLRVVFITKELNVKSVISSTQFDRLGVTLLLSEMAKVKVDQNTNFIL